MKIHPGRSVGTLAVGMAKEEYETIMGGSGETFKRTPDATDLVVAYDDKLMHLTVDYARRIRSITVFRPERVELGNVQLLGRDIAAVEGDLANSGYTFLRVDAGLWSPNAGVLLIEQDGIVDGVEVMATQNSDP
jgi:hypothetical protein